MKKNTFKLTLLTAILGIGCTANAQNWLTGGNSAIGTEKLGTTNAYDLNFFTNNSQRLTLKADGTFGLGIIAPRGWQEIVYCPTLGGIQNGLIVTKNNCQNNWSAADPALGDFIGGGIVEADTGQGGEGNTTFTVPFSFLTGHSTNLTTPLYSSNGPLFWVRTEDPHPSPFYSGPAKFDTKMIVMPDGSIGINIAQPRAALDVRGSQIPNRPAAIFGSRAIGTGGATGPNGLLQYYTQQIQIVPVLKINGYNRISQANDQGIFFSDGKGTEGANLNGALILAPWSNNNDSTVGGMRMDKFGNTEFHGTLRTTKIKVDAKWWSDFVFAPEYKLMNLSELEKYIIKNKHLPNVPSESDILKNGIDLANMQAIQQQKIEELTLYIIQLQKQMEAMKVELDELKQ
ncbi:MAG: hypothetical protein IT232_02060 [Flavobacteriales bacterium]|nr:hypothetical protein [Flavobacteriales bacterium]